MASVLTDLEHFEFYSTYEKQFAVQRIMYRCNDIIDSVLRSRTPEEGALPLPLVAQGVLRIPDAGEGMRTDEWFLHECIDAARVMPPLEAALFITGRLVYNR